VIILANEFFDALPIRQYQRTDDGWRERLVTVDDATGAFAWALSPPLARPPLLPDSVCGDASAGAIAEVCPAGIALAHAIGERLRREGGAALIVDYGHGRSAPGDTLQAVRYHAYAEVLADPGSSDLTAHVDFEVLLRAATEAGARGFGPVAQGIFLEALGLAARAEALLARATPAQAEDIRAARHRLTGSDQMGTLFEAIALQHPRLPSPPGFP